MCLDQQMHVIGLTPELDQFAAPRATHVGEDDAQSIQLPTEVADAEGVLRRSQRKCRIEIHTPQEGEPAMLYEMGIPVVETGVRWHVNVLQKVPISFDRDNVSASYMARVRAVVLEAMAAELDQSVANATWVKDAVSRHAEELSDATISRIADLRFGERRVSYDPSDPEVSVRSWTS